MTLSLRFFSLALVLALTGTCVVPPPGVAQVVSPSPKTRTFLAPKDDYFQQVTKGHPFRWFDRDMAVRVLIEPGAGIVNFRPEFEKILRESFHEWETSSNSRIKFRFISESPADITCRFVAELPKQEPLVAGVTSYQTSPHHMDSAVITIKTQYGAKPLDLDLMRGVCLHEIGHALGLVNHSLDLEPWIVEVSRKAHGAWMMDGSGKTEVVVGLRKNGRVAHLVILQSSGSEAFDKSVLNACMTAEPYPAAPGSAADTIEVNLLFEQ